MKTAKLGIGMEGQMDARPHPGPLPQERENRRPFSRETTALRSVTRLAANEQGVAIAIQPNEFSSDATWLTLAPGERAGVRASVCLISLLLSSAALVNAQSYSIDWFTIDGGGGTSTGSVYSVSGTIGQPDAGKMSGGNYTIDGGFWSLLSVVQTPGAPLLTITLNSQLSTITLSWPSPSGGFVLQENSVIGTTNWLVVAQVPADDGTNKTVTVSPPVENRFYRLKYP